MYEHLSALAGQMVSTPIPEKLAFILAPRWIGTDIALLAHAKISKLLDRPPAIRTRGLTLVGPYFNGKTMIAERFALQQLRSGDRQRVWVIQTREGAGMAHFLSGIIKDFRAPEPPRHTVPKMMEQVDVLFRTLKPRILIFDEFHNALRGRTQDIAAIFAFLRRIGHDYDISPVLIGEVAVYDYINATTEMASRFENVAIPRWKYDESYLALLDTLEAAMPLAKPSNLSTERLARRLFAKSEGLIGETVTIVAEAAVAAVESGKEHISIKTIDGLKYVPASQRRLSALREALL